MRLVSRVVEGNRPVEARQPAARTPRRYGANSCPGGARCEGCWREPPFAQPLCDGGAVFPAPHGVDADESVGGTLAANRGMVEARGVTNPIGYAR